MPKVSIIVPVYNAEGTIERCVRSLMGQTLTDIEILFVDDCSTDKTLPVLKALTGKDNRCRVLQSEKNGGPAAARRIAIGQATGDYVIGCDADDYADPTWCEKLYGATDNGKTDIVWCDFHKNDGDGWHDMEQQPVKTKADGTPDLTEETRSLLLGRRQGALWNHLIRRRLYDSVTEWPTCSMAEDLALLVELYNIAKTMAYVHEPLYWYDYSPQSLSRTEVDQKLVRQARYMEDNTLLMERMLKAKGVYGKYRQEFVFRKFFNKRWMLPALHTMADCRLWRNIHGDINLSIFSCPYITKAGKVTSMLCLTRLYPIVKRMLRR